MTGFAQVAFPDKSNGSLIERDGKIVGSRLAAQEFTCPRYFHERPSATAPAYNAGATTFANLGPTNPDLAKNVKAAAAGDPEARAAVQPGPHDRRHPGRRRHDLGLGIDPDISPAYARSSRAASPPCDICRWQPCSS